MKMLKQTMQLKLKPPKSNQICAVTGILLGLWAMFTTQAMTKELFGPITKACSLSNGSGTSHLHENEMDETTTYKLHPHEPLLGGTFVCSITQFLHELIQHSGGIFAMGSIASLSIVAALLMNVEADRFHGTSSSNIIQYPTILGILSQVLRISVVFPLLWVPGYCLGYSSFSANTGGGAGGESGGTTYTSSVSISIGGGGAGMGKETIASGSNSTTTGSTGGKVMNDDHIPCELRVYAALVMALFFPILTVLVFNLDPDSYAWTFTAGLLGGPLLACSSLLLWYVLPHLPMATTTHKSGRKNHHQRNHNNINNKESHIHSSSSLDNHHRQRVEISRALSSAYRIAAIIALIGHIINLRLITKVHGFNLSSIWNELWTSAHPTVAFTTIDVVVLFLGVLLYISVQKDGLISALQALVLMPFIGPGSACALIMSGLEQRRAIQLEEDCEKDL